MDTDTTGSISYQLTGEHLTHKQASGTSDIYKPKIKQNSSSGDLLIIVSEKAIQTSRNGNIILTGAVRVEQTTPQDSPVFTLLTQNLTYNPLL